MSVSECPFRETMWATINGFLPEHWVALIQKSLTRAMGSSYPESMVANMSYQSNGWLYGCQQSLTRAMGNIKGRKHVLAVVFLGSSVC